MIQIMYNPVVRKVTFFLKGTKGKDWLMITHPQLLAWCMANLDVHEGYTA